MFDGKLRYEVGGEPPRANERRRSGRYEEVRKILLSLPRHLSGESEWIRFRAEDKKDAMGIAHCVQVKSKKNCAWAKQMLGLGLRVRTALRSDSNGEWWLWCKVVQGEKEA